MRSLGSAQCLAHSKGLKILLNDRRKKEKRKGTREGRREQESVCWSQPYMWSLVEYMIKTVSSVERGVNIRSGLSHINNRKKEKRKNCTELLLLLLFLTTGWLGSYLFVKIQSFPSHLERRVLAMWQFQFWARDKFMMEKWNMSLRLIISLRLIKDLKPEMLILKV